MAARAKAYVAEGYRRIQVKVGLDPDEDIERLTAVREALGRSIVLFADANGGWTTHQARRFLRATRDLDYYHGAALRHLCRMPSAARRLRPPAGAR